jgi:hypothetical protein
MISSLIGFPVKIVFDSGKKPKDDGQETQIFSAKDARNLFAAPPPVFAHELLREF